MKRSFWAISVTFYNLELTLEFWEIRHFLKSKYRNYRRNPKLSGRLSSLRRQVQVQKHQKSTILSVKF